MDLSANNIQRIDSSEFQQIEIISDNLFLRKSGEAAGQQKTVYKHVTTIIKLKFNIHPQKAWEELQQRSLFSISSHFPSEYFMRFILSMKKQANKNCQRCEWESFVKSYIICTGNCDEH
ncbi:CLUMA_CG005601, isoform A [Clunio marinus]|uniref:CLUMA_CG005601, isoform A n=1 Tax=Clunio marinus TaxID=568069 RepID=A0A1J1HVG9_9DIPT|nr:CLUMA_CG005601, isoform A [Clunio marinus]